MRPELTNNRTAGIDTYHSTMFTLLLDLNVISQGVKLVSVLGPIQEKLILSGPDQCNHCITPWL